MRFPMSCIIHLTVNVTKSINTYGASIHKLNTTSSNLGPHWCKIKLCQSITNIGNKNFLFLKMDQC